MPDSPLDLYGTLIDNSPVAMVLYDRDMRIVHLNDEFARLSRLDARQARGQVLYDLAPATRARRHIHDTVLSGESIDQANVPYKFPNEPRPTWSDIHYRPVRDPEGNVVGILSAIIDVTEAANAQQELQDLLGHKDDFLDLSAHELRTPITVIKAFAQLAQRPEFRHRLPWQQHAFEVIGRHADHLVHLVNDMIEVSRIGRGPLPLYKEKFDLCELIGDLERDYAPIFERCACAVELPDKPVMLDADRNRIGAVFANIIENADRYAGEDKPCAIRIRVEPQGKAALTSVHDNGIGIPPDEQDKVFERFFRASNAGTRARNGLGLGLYICKSVVEQHHGRIWLESAQDKGSTFYFTLPLLQV